MIARHDEILADLERRAVWLVGAEVWRGGARDPSREHMALSLVVIRRAEVGDDGLDRELQRLGQHVVTGGMLCLVGWTQGEVSWAPQVHPWRSVDGRLWAPLVCEGTLLAWLCLGVSADGT